MADEHNLPVEFVDGYLSEISVSIPWTSLLTDSSYVEVSGMVITVQPKQRIDSGMAVVNISFLFAQNWLQCNLKKSI